jgi:nucleotide-binding universal stress UspA family protein
MTQPIVAGIDPLDDDDAPLVLAAALARATGAPLVVVASYQHDPIGNAVSAGLIENDLRAAAREQLERRAGDLGAELVAAAGRSAARALQDVAAERGAALIVVGSTRKGLVSRVAPGSTAERLLHGSGCAVAVAPAGIDAGWSPARIGVGFVATAEAEGALAAAARLARTTGSGLHALTAVAPKEWGVSAVVEPYQAGPEAAVELARRALEQAVAGLALDPPASAEVVVADPVAALERLSRSCDLLVCGSRGHGPRGAVLLGSVTHALMRRAACPLMVIPRGAADPAAALLGGEQAIPS